MSLDVSIHEGTSYVPPVTLVTGNTQQTSQAFITLLLTEENSVPLNTNLGVNLGLGKRNTFLYENHFRDIIKDIFDQMSSEYGLEAIDIVSYSTASDVVDTSIRFVYEDSTTENLFLTL